MSGLELLNPWALALIGGLPLLLLAYRRQSDRKARNVPSLLLLQRLTRIKPPQQRFKPPWTALLELLALLTIIASATFPIWGREPHNVAVLIDNSLSTLKNPDNKAINLLIKERAKALLSGYAHDTRFSIYTSSPELQLLGTESVTTSAAKDLVESVQVSLTADNLERAVGQITAARTGKARFDELLVLTDRKVSQTTPDKTEKDAGSIDSASFSATKALSLATSSGGTSAVGPIVGSAALTTTVKVEEVRGLRVTDNLYLAPFRVLESGPENPRKLVGELYAAIPGPHQATVQLSGSSDPDSLTVLASQQVSFEVGVSASVEFSLPEAAANYRVFKISITSPNDPSSNNLSADDTVWLSTDALGGSQLLLVTAADVGDSRLLGLERLHQFAVRRLTPEEYANQSAETIKQAALIVFHRTAPEILPQVPALFITPPASSASTTNAIFSTKYASSNLSVTSWKEEHPILSYLRVPLLEISTAEVFTTPAWAQNIINAQQGAILIAGEARGIRLAATGFELLPFEGAATPTTSILTLNTIRWLTKKETLGDSVLVGSELSAHSGQTVVISDPQKHISTIEPSPAIASTWRYTVPGPYLVSTISGEDANSIENRSRLIAANVFFPEESGVAASTTLPSRVTHPSNSESIELGTVWYVAAWIAIALMLLEYLLRASVPRQKSPEVISN